MSKTLSPAFGNWLQEVRLAAKMTQDDLAAASGLNKITISRIENAKVGYSPDSVERLAVALNVSVSEALLRAGFGQVDTMRPDVELTRLMDGLTPEQQRTLLNAARSFRNALIGATV